MAIKLEEKVEVAAYAPRVITERFGYPDGCELVGSDQGNPALRFAWPETCPVCQSRKLFKKYAYSNNGNCLERQCERCGTLFKIAGV